MIWFVGKNIYLKASVFLFVIVFFILSSFFVQPAALFSYVFIALSVASIVLFLFHRRSLDLFEPLPWFLLMSSLFYVFSALICFLGFDFLYHDNFVFREDRYDVLIYVIALFTIGVLCFMIGDSVASSFGFKFNPRKKKVPYHLSKNTLLLLGAGLVVLGVVNFLINSYAYNSADLFMLLKDFGARDHRIQDGIFYSTLGYNFIISGLFFLMYRRAVYFKNLGMLYKAVFLVCLVVLLSTGRIWYAVSLIFVFMGIAHFSGMQISLKSLICYCLALCLVVLTIYFVRLYSNLAYIDSGDDFSAGFVSDFSAQIVEFIFGRSNVPSVPIFMEVVDFYSDTHSFYGGKTLLYWLTYFAPSYDVTFLGHEIKDRFYPGRPGGFPPTVFGEFYANGGEGFLILASLYLGFVIKLLYIYVKQRESFLLYFIYTAILFRFIFMLPKLETSSLGSAVWLFLPTVTICILLRLVTFENKARENA